MLSEAESPACTMQFQLLKREEVLPSLRTENQCYVPLLLNINPITNVVESLLVGTSK